MRLMSPRNVMRRAAVVLAATGLATIGLAAPASAHVTINPNTAVQGGYAKFAFRVPTERDDASTTKLEVTLPEGQAIASVSTKPLPGWAVDAAKTKLATPIKSDDGEITEAVQKITWTAAPDAVIKPGQFQEFEVSLGPLPKVDTLVFKALQTYSDGQVVRWIEDPPTDGGAEPEHPAPVLKLAKSAASAPADAAANDAATQASSGSSGDGDGLAVGLGVAGLVLGLAGLVAGLLAYRRASATASGT
jgi:uncharacterized protein YcnI